MTRKAEIRVVEFGDTKINVIQGGNRLVLDHHEAMQLADQLVDLVERATDAGRAEP